MKSWKDTVAWFVVLGVLSIEGRTNASFAACASRQVTNCMYHFIGE